MKNISILGKKVKLDPHLPYLSIGDIGSNHGGSVRGSYDNPQIRLQRNSQKVKDLEDLLIFSIGLEVDLQDVVTLLRTGAYDNDTTITLREQEREQYLNTVALYVLALETIANLFQEHHQDTWAEERKQYAADVKQEFKL